MLINWILPAMSAHDDRSMPRLVACEDDNDWLWRRHASGCLPTQSEPAPRERVEDVVGALTCVVAQDVAAVGRAERPRELPLDEAEDAQGE
jgi:hypothetical protein